ncbi:hypothetical protein BWI17_16310 [Betaproteobacteria bacterium GR16-43]|nr:hypothetical protein BWI17_16310 [Betaproteobacteria bacterium GR16-43]
MGTVRSHDLSALLRAGRPANDPAVKTALIALSKEIRSRLISGSRESRDFFISSAESIGRLKGSTHRSVRADCLLDCCKFLYVCGDSAIALESARQACELASKLGDAPRERTALNTLGILYADTANFVQAVECYSRALELARKLDLPEPESGTWINLAVALSYMSRYQEALECLDRAATRARDAGSWAPILIRKVAHNESICWFHLGELNLARERAEFSIFGASEPADSTELFSRLVREHNYVRILLDLGEFSLARNRVSIVTKFAFGADTARAHEMQSVVRGIVEAYCGDFSKGVAEVAALLDKLGASQTTHHDALVALARAHERAGNHGKALEYLHRLLILHQSRRQQSALLHIANAGATNRLKHSSQLDLAPLQVRHSRLQAAVAEGRRIGTQLDMLERLAITADLRDDSSGAHGFRVGRLSSLLAVELGWSEVDSNAIELAARLHDIGKTGIPDRVVLSSEILQRDERRLMNTHAEIGAELLAKSNVPQIQLAEEIARCHHERWDGSGYPNQLAGKRIPISARIVALADVFDAMTHGRPYEQELSIEDALDEIGRLSGRHFDPSITGPFQALIRRLVQGHADLDSYLGEASRKSPFFVARGRIQRLLDDAQAGS